MPETRRNTQIQSIAIASGGTTSPVISAQGWSSFGLIFPATLTSTSMTFTVAEDADSTFVALYDTSNNQVSVTVAVNRAYDMPAQLASWPFFKIVLGSAEGAARTLTLVMKS